MEAETMWGEDGKLIPVTSEVTSLDGHCSKTIQIETVIVMNNWGGNGA